MKGYSLVIPEGVVLGKARLEGVDASFKELAAVCDNIKGMKVEEAINFLEKVQRMETPVRFRRWNKKMGHRRGLKGKYGPKGRFPVKAARIVEKVLRSAYSNSLSLGLEGDLYVVHASANKKENFPRLQPKGRRIRHDYETARVEVIVTNKENWEKLKEAKRKSWRDLLKEKGKEEREESPKKGTKAKRGRKSKSDVKG